MQGMSLPVRICVDVEWNMHKSSPFWPPNSILLRFPFINFHKGSTFRAYYNCLLKWSVRAWLDGQGLGLGSNPVWGSHLCFWFLCLWFQVHNKEIIILVHSTSQRTKRRSHCQEWAHQWANTLRSNVQGPLSPLARSLWWQKKTWQIRKLKQMPPLMSMCFS